eukprot:GEZU01027367.1.p1 GENE.GEZU01027367.1~~GEZU01027367.1.p1  ORF type:complete len:180 (-),score=20.12 GEZU01027367.1:337-876(-)
MFGTAFMDPASFQMHRGHPVHPQARQRRPPTAEEKASASCYQLLQLLPILLLLIISLLNFGGSSTEKPAFMVHQSNDYPIQRLVEITNDLKLPYYVDTSFDKEYASDKRALREIERQVIQVHTQILRQKCHQESLRQQRMFANAQYFNGNVKDSKMKEAEGFIKESCQKLDRLVNEVIA